MVRAIARLKRHTRIHRCVAQPVPCLPVTQKLQNLDSVLDIKSWPCAETARGGRSGAESARTLCSRHVLKPATRFRTPQAVLCTCGTICEISEEFAGAHIHAGSRGGRRASGPDVSDPRGGRRSIAGASHRPHRRRASMPSCASAQQRLSLSLSPSLSLTWASPPHSARRP